LYSRIVTYLRRRPIEVWIAVAVFAGALVYLSAGSQVGAGRDVPAFDIDEAHKLAESYYYHLAFEQLDRSAPAWSEDFYARTNPPVAKYVFGLTLALAGHHVHDQSLQRDFDSLWGDPGRLRARVPDPMLRVTRATSLFFAALVCALLALIAGRVGGAVAAVLAPCWLLGNATFEFVARLGLTDSIMLFHLLLIVPVSWGALRAIDRFDRAAGSDPARWARLAVRTVVLPGAVIALAAGSKLNGAFAAPVYALTLLCGGWMGGGERRLSERLGNATLLIAATAVVSVACFVSINPSFHAQPLERALALPGVVENWMIKQQLSPGGGLFGLREKAATAGWVTLFSPYLALSRLGGSLGSLVGVLACGAGVVALSRSCLSRPRAEDPAAGERRRASVAVACWIVLVTVLVTVWAPLARVRYFLPPAVGVGILFGIGVAGVPALLRQAVGLLRDSRRPAVGRAWVAGVVLALVLGIAVTYRIVDPTLLDPQRLGVAVNHESLQAYRDGASRHPGSSLRQRRLGVILMYAGDPLGAMDALTEALEALPAGTGDVEVSVQRAVTLFDLARASARAGEHERSLQALRDHLSLVNALRGRARDPFVRREFDAVIAERSPGPR